MEEIADRIFIEEGYQRVVLGAIWIGQRLVMVDAPFSHEDGQSWKTKLSHLGTGLDRLLLLLDAHIDRTLTAQAMETDVLIHENALNILNNRSESLKSRELELEPDWTHAELPQGTRFCKPHMTFSDEVLVNGGEDQLIISHRSGAHFSGAWLICESRKLVFIGDSVVTDQPPFLSKSDLPIWNDDLTWLLSDRFADFKIVSGRNGVISSTSIRKMLDFLIEVKEGIEDLQRQDMPLTGAPELSGQLLKKIDFDPKMQDRYDHRMTRGIEQYIKRNYSIKEIDTKGENE